ncbi:MAG: formate/nitrite transporter family protein [Clostridia bacterium]
MLNKYLEAFCKAILAGLMIAVGASAYLVVENHYVGAMLFTIGLFTIYTLDFYLYTGKVGYLLRDKDVLKIVVIWLGNLVGVLGSAALVLNTRMITTTEIIEHATSYAETKISDGLLSIFILACFCGLMMYIAAQAYNTTKDTANSVGGYVGLFLCVMVFLLLGFDHSIANMYYFTMAGAWSGEAVIALIVATLGNALGGLFPSLIMLPFKNSTHH